MTARIAVAQELLMQVVHSTKGMKRSGEGRPVVYKYPARLRPSRFSVRACTVVATSKVSRQQKKEEKLLSFYYNTISAMFSLATLIGCGFPKSSPSLP